MSLPVKPASHERTAARWNYVEVEVLDGERILHPTHVAFDRLIFVEPPKLLSEFVRIVITNNGQPHSSQARVLAHQADARHIPIELVPSASAAEDSTRLTA
jgi:hypothetical protein